MLKELKDIIEKYTTLSALDFIAKYNTPDRFYHNLSHLEYLYNMAKREGKENDPELMLTLLFHDIVYDTKSGTNEEDSAKFFEQHFKGPIAIRDDVYKMILDTKKHIPSSEKSKTFIRWDLNILNETLPTLIDYEKKIRKEYEWVDVNTYKTRRIEVLKGLAEKHNINLDGLIAYVEKTY